MRGLLLWTPVALLAGWAALRWSGLDGGFPVVQLLAFTPYAAAVAVLPLAAALALRRWRAAAAAAAVVVLLAWVVLPRAVPASHSVRDGRLLHVLTVNLRLGGADAHTVADLVHRYHVDLLALQEYTPDADRALDGVLPYKVAYPQPGAVGSALYSRYPLRDGSVRVHASGFTQARATLGGVQVESVHPCAPSDVDTTDRYWARDLADQPPASGPVVRLLVGDFNATLDHPPLRRLLATGYRDAGDVLGDGLTPTWPYDGRPVPRVTLDHVLVDRRVGVADYAVHPVPGTDHRAVYAALMLPAWDSP